ncbi:hypothetical protein DQ237_12955 [Blastococcus sp. TF02-8]|nr:hypothetical protein DQ237_12955 [Blastococcus sp. TF02-8]
MVCSPGHAGAQRNEFGELSVEIGQRALHVPAGALPASRLARIPRIWAKFLPACRLRRVKVRRGSGRDAGGLVPRYCSL